MSWTTAATTWGPSSQTAAVLRAIAANITINGLAILNEDPLLEQYYLTHVVAGAGAFTLVADG